MSCSCNQTRRQFLRTASMASMAGFYVSPFLLELNSLAAMAQGTGGSDYRALVCVYLQGGNDGHGTVIATDPDSFAAFTSARSGAPGLAYPMANCCPSPSKHRSPAARSLSILLSVACKLSSTRAAPPSLPTREPSSRRPAKPRSTQTPSSSPIRSSPTSIKPPHGRPSLPILVAASAWAGAAQWPTPLKP